MEPFTIPIPVLFGFGLGPMEMLIVGAIAVLLFGNRLPDVARSLGKSFVEFKKGIHGIESEINDAIYESKSSVPSATYEDSVDRTEPSSGPRFEAPQEGDTPSEGSRSDTDVSGSD